MNGVAFATFVASGQTCIMGARVLVHESVYDKFMGALVAKVISLFFHIRLLTSRIRRIESEWVILLT